MCGDGCGREMGELGTGLTDYEEEVVGCFELVEAGDGILGLVFG